MTGDEDRNRDIDDRDEDRDNDGGERERPKTGRRDKGAQSEVAQPPSSEPDPLPDDDPKPNDDLIAFKRGAARAKANEPLEPAASALLSNEPDIEKARLALEQAYRDAAAVNPVGSLRQRYHDTDRLFHDAAEELIKTSGGRRSVLDEWISRNLVGPKAPLRALLGRRRQVEGRLRARWGKREAILHDAKAATEIWAKAWERWTKPVENIKALIDGYAPRIDRLLDQANTEQTLDKAIFEFWFDVAPLHLQLRRDKVNSGNAPGVDRLRDALADFPDVAALLEAGGDRNDGSLFLIDPNGFGQKRADILGHWQARAEAEADAALDYALRPDSAADLKPRHDKLRDNKWFEPARQELTPPA